MEISDDEANMIAGRIFDAIERSGIFNRQLVATEIKAGLALVKAPVKRSGSVQFENYYPRPQEAHERENYRQQVALARIAREQRERAIDPPAFVPENYYPRHPDYKPPSIPEAERAMVKDMERLLGMPLSPGKRDPDGTAHYRLPDTRKAKEGQRCVKVGGATFAVAPPYAMDNYEAESEILRWLNAYGEPPTWATRI
jgi:hypothetical protein